MRIPRRKIYRAFHELDQFTDEQCERFMQRVRVRTPYRASVTVLCIVACIVAFVVAIQAMTAWDRDLVRLLRMMEVPGRLADTAVLGVWIGIVPAAPLFALLITRDVILWTYVRRIVKQRIDAVRCLTCRYVLLGQRVRRGLVTCPECGGVNPLGQLGVVEEDLLPRDFLDDDGDDADERQGPRRAAPGRECEEKRVSDRRN